MFKISTLATAATLVVAALATTKSANAQGYYGGSHYDNVPHTTTHTDYVRHGNHVDAVPHSTTHYDQVRHSNYGSNYGFQSSYQSQRNLGYGAGYGNQNFGGQVYGRRNSTPHTTTHYDRTFHNGHVDVTPHTTTHFHRN